MRTKLEQNTIISGKEQHMTQLVRDMAAFASISLFLGSLSVMLMAL
jgi:hypothetical protein